METLPALATPAAPASPGKLPGILRNSFLLVAVMLLLSTALSLAANALTSPWRLDLFLDNDTVRYYETQQFEVHNTGDFFRALADPFFRAPDAGVIEAPNGKPVLVSILRLWGMGVRTCFGHDAWLTRESYFHFQLFAFGLLAFSICLLGWRLGSPYLGMLAAAVAVMNPWALVQLVYRNYTCLGMALLFFACLLALRRKWWSTLLAGLLAWMAFLTDNAILPYSGMLGVVVLALAWGSWRRVIARGLLFFAGLALPYLLLTLVGLIWYRTYEWPVAVTVEYFKFFASANHFATRADAEGRTQVPKFPAIALLFIRETSWTVLGLLIVTALATYWKTARVGVRAALNHPALAPLLGLLVPMVLVWIAADLKPGAQVAHSYFVSYPLVALAIAIFWWRVANKTWLLRGLWMVVVLAYATETVRGLRHYREVFFSLQNTVTAATTADKHEKIAILYNDPHAKIMQHLLSPEYADRIVIILQITDIGELAVGRPVKLFSLTGPGLLQLQPITLEKGDYISLLLFGPTGETMVYCPPVPIWPDDPRHGQRQILTSSEVINTSDGKLVVSFSDSVKIPFYGLYPLLIFDDEWPTWKYITGVLNDDSCMNDPGMIRMSKITYPQGLSNGATPKQNP